jgi:ribosomal protein S18 acetylase RimI-like enzyme
VTPEFDLRTAEAADADRVAALHAASWRSAYRGLLADAYLDGDIDGERRAVWRVRLATAGDETVLACGGGTVLGFCCFRVDADPRWGTLVDNLHADPAHRGLGIGRRLLSDVARRAGAAAPGRPVHLFCLAGNGAARGFYERLGGEVVERCEHDEPDGRRHPVLRYAWASPAALAAGCR